MENFIFCEVLLCPSRDIFFESYFMDPKGSSGLHLLTPKIFWWNVLKKYQLYFLYSQSMEKTSVDDPYPFYMFSGP